MARLAVRRVHYDGVKYTFDAVLKDGLNIVVGPNGSGKSTFASLIYYALSGDVSSFRADKQNRHKEITTDRNNYVELLVAIDAKEYTLTRYIGSNDIAVSSGDAIEVLPIHRTKDVKHIFSDWILHQLGIEPIHLQFGTVAWQINIRDLMRLMYHDQAMDPSDVYKATDGDTNFVVDSKLMRKAIFEILMGKRFQEYYAALAQYRDRERERSQVAGALDEFRNALFEIQSGREDLNLIFIDKRLTESRSRLEKLTNHRRTLATPAPKSAEMDPLDEQKQELLEIGLREADLVGRDNDLLAEIDRLQKIRSSLMLEATQIRKMVFAHEQLSLFSANTCPYCLQEVSRNPHKCVCGASVDEKAYERFFYEADEYLTILKSKQKNVETVELAIDACRKEREAAHDERKGLEARSHDVRTIIRKRIGDVGLAVDITQFDEIDDAIVQVRSEIAALEQQRELEAKRERLEEKLATLKRETDSARLEASQLEQQAEQEMIDRRMAFSEKYSELMRQTVKDCRQASIDADYMPQINAGEYKEASSNVPKRLMYYATMLFLAKQDATIPFPRFVLIDTPDTAGIDQENLIIALARVSEIVSANGASCQVILTTGEGKYPAANETDVVARLSATSRLLQAKHDLTDN